MIHIKEYSSITHYLERNLLFSLRDYEDALAAFTIACENGLQDFARVKARTISCGIMNLTGGGDDKKYDLYLSEIDSIAPNLSEEIKGIVKRIVSCINIIAAKIFLHLLPHHKGISEKIKSYSYKTMRKLSRQTITISERVIK